ncbi:MAG: SusC/RagA family TonB-linked outer membrane protein [Candidatus Pseudobacter hemicellulosilyticus]|uniref:SusC/RagA family TonB-linked outer membrane protein n=1 Tax=Candidatus Pseudobacter hemicellulosilyticus TaxID=3121375 RepID=A0AAJ5WSH4_9BACT|nr:MAG: SusC/RagA family TonB-linked outer membrane protein [Pseudobacter sp.]
MIILIIGLLPSVVVSGQTAPAPKPAQTVVKGIVRDDKGQPLDGVSITLKGSATSVISTEDGSFSIRVPDTRATLVFTFVNYTRKEVPLNGRTTLAVSMLTDKKAMDEVVIIGYGTQKKREVTSAISSIKAGEIEKYNVTSFQQALQGQMPGVEMYESSGVPGAAVNVRIRGLNTVNGSAGPLYVVDGIPIISGGGGDGDGPITNDGGFGGSGTNGLTDINPADIESIEVLKDAASAAIYGARGSGGVVLITTKRAKAGKTTFNLNIINGFNRMSNRRELLDGPQLLTILDEAHRNTFYSNPANAGLPLTATPMPGIKNFDRGMADTTNIDYLDQILRTGLYHEATLTAMNGSERTKFYISGTFKRTEGNISGSDMNQYNFRINIDHSWNKAIRFGASIAPSLNKEFRLGSGTAIQYGGYGAATTTNLPIYPLRNADGTYFNAWTNPMAYRNRDLYENTSRRVRLLASAYFEADLLPGLKSKTIVQREDFDQVGDYYIDGLLRLRSSSSVTPFPDDQLSMAGMQNSYGWANSFESYFTYDKRFRKKHHVNIVLGTRYNEVDTKYEAMYGENFANRHQVNPSQAAFVTNGWQTGAVGEPAATLGYYFRTNYKFKDRYLAGFTINRDGSSRFGSNQRFGTFPAASVGWIISDEPFMRNVKGIDLLKVRFSGGLTGNAQGISNTASIRTWGTSVNSSGYMNTATTIPNRPGNTSLRWEKGRKFDAGLDIAFLRNRLEATVDVYHYTTTDMLLEIPVGTTFGYAQPSVNISFLENRGSLVNKGIEFSVNSVNTTGRLTWKTNFNISVNQTRIVDLGGLNPETVSGGSGYTQLYVGNQGPVYYLVEWAGVDPATGREMIYDADGKKVIASTLNAQQLAAARKPQFDKLPAPKFYGGIGNTFSFKQWTLSVFFSYRVGNWILDAGERQASYVGNLPVNYSNAGQSVAIGNISSRVWDRWTTPGQETDVPKPFYNDAANDVLKTLNTTRFLSDASFIRLKNLNLQYTIPAKAYSRLKLKSARVFFTGQNLFLLTKFDGVDPEALNVTGTNRDRNLAYGIINNVVPLARSFTLGFSVGF